MRFFTLITLAIAAFTTTAQAEERLAEPREADAVCEVPDERESGLRSACTLTNDGCWYTSGCGTPHAELVTGAMETLLNGCHIPDLPDNCMWDTQVGSVDVWVDGSQCSLSAGATNDPGPATGLNRLIDQILSAPVPHGAVITGYDVLGVDPFRPVAQAGHVRVHYRTVSCWHDPEPMPVEPLPFDPTAATPVNH